MTSICIYTHVIDDTYVESWIYTHREKEVETGRTSEICEKRYGKVERVNLKLVAGCGFWMLDRNSWYALVSPRTCRLLARSLFCSCCTLPPLLLRFLSFPDITNSLYILPPPSPSLFFLAFLSEGKFPFELILNVTINIEVLSFDKRRCVSV